MYAVVQVQRFTILPPKSVAPTTRSYVVPLAVRLTMLAGQRSTVVQSQTTALTLISVAPGMSSALDLTSAFLLDHAMEETSSVCFACEFWLHMMSCFKKHEHHFVHGEFEWRCRLKDTSETWSNHIQIQTDPKIVAQSRLHGKERKHNLRMQPKGR